MCGGLLQTFCFLNTRKEGDQTMVTRGYLYVLSNSYIPKLLKIGFTNRSVEERIGELSSTGIPGKYKAVFYVHLDEAEWIEKKIHDELRKYREDKEFFQLSPEKAVKKIKTFLLEQNVRVHGYGGEYSSVYLTPHEEEAARQKALREKERKLKEHKAILAKRKRESEALERIHKAHQVFKEHYKRYVYLVQRGWKEDIGFFESWWQISWQIGHKVGVEYAKRFSDAEKKSFSKFYNACEYLCNPGEDAEYFRKYEDKVGLYEMFTALEDSIHVIDSRSRIPEIQGHLRAAKYHLDKDEDYYPDYKYR